MKKIKHINLISSYAKVLLSISGDQLGFIRKEVESLLTFLKNRRDIFVYLSHPTNSSICKKEAIFSINKSLNENLIRFIMVIFANRRSSLLVFILEKFLDLVRKNENELEMTIRSAEILKETDMKIITESLSFLGKIVKVNNVVDPSILGGFMVRYGFNLIDASLKSYLDRLVDLSKVEILKIRNIL